MPTSHSHRCVWQHALAFCFVANNDGGYLGVSDGPPPRVTVNGHRTTFAATHAPNPTQPAPSHTPSISIESLDQDARRTATRNVPEERARASRISCARVLGFCIRRPFFPTPSLRESAPLSLCTGTTLLSRESPCGSCHMHLGGVHCLVCWSWGVQGKLAGQRDSHKRRACVCKAHCGSPGLALPPSREHQRRGRQPGVVARRGATARTSHVQDHGPAQTLEWPVHTQGAAWRRRRVPSNSAVGSHSEAEACACDWGFSACVLPYQATNQATITHA